MRSVAGLAKLLLVIGAVLVGAIRFAAVDAGSHSASDTLRPWIIQMALVAVVAAGLWFAIDLAAGRIGRR